MNRQELDDLLSQIRSQRELTLAELAEVTEDEFSLPTDLERWTDLRRVLLRFGDHMREHANQVEGARAAIGKSPSMPQRMLAESELAWGKLLAATVGLSDDELRAQPPDGGWSIYEVLQHILAVENDYLEGIRRARVDR